MDKFKKHLAFSILYIFLIIVLIVTVYPLLYTLASSFKSNQEIMTSGASLIPKEFTLDNYKQAWVVADFKRYTWNSLYMTFFIVVGVMLASSMGGYVFSRGKFPGKNIIFAIFTSTMFLSMGSISLFPLIDIAKIFHLNTSLWGVIIINIFSLYIGQLYLVRSYINSIPHEIDNAAKIDGCSFFRIFWNIILPLSKPIIATIGLLTFKMAWNEYLLPLVFTLSNPKQTPLVVGIVKLKSSGDVASSWNLMFAGTMIAVLPMLLVYLFLNRYFIAGLLSGGVKG